MLHMFLYLMPWMVINGYYCIQGTEVTKGEYRMSSTLYKSAQDRDEGRDIIHIMTATNLASEPQH